MPKSKSRKKRPPKRVLTLPGPRTRHDGGSKQPDVRQRPAHLRSRNSPVRRMRPTMQFRISTQLTMAGQSSCGHGLSGCDSQISRRRSSRTIAG
jgi:hypothetical protein